MTERRVRRIEDVLKDHDRQSPKCVADMKEYVLRRTGTDPMDEFEVDVRARCGRCGLWFQWSEWLPDVVGEGRLLPQAASGTL